MRDKRRMAAGSLHRRLRMNIHKTAGIATMALLVTTTPWVEEPTPSVNLVGRPVLQIGSLPDGPYRALVLQGLELAPAPSLSSAPR